VSLLIELDAFYTEHRRCGELEAGDDGVVVWIACDCAAWLVERTRTTMPPAIELNAGRHRLPAVLAGVLILDNMPELRLPRPPRHEDGDGYWHWTRAARFCEAR
jgi:hypothetical protein